MLLNQISVFIENKSGRLADVTEVLGGAGVDIRALSIADTADYGILRLIVDDPEKAEKALKANNTTVSITKVIAISVSDAPGSFANAVRILSNANINVEYAYAFITPKEGSAFVIVRVDDNEKAMRILNESGVRLLKQADIF